MSAFTAGLEKIEQAVAQPTLSDITIEKLRTIIEGLRAVPVNVEIKVIPVEPQPSDPDMLVGIQSEVVQGDSDDAKESEAEPKPVPIKKRKST